jgi:hypothetical protein
VLHGVESFLLLHGADGVVDVAGGDVIRGTAALLGARGVFLHRFPLEQTANTPTEQQLELTSYQGRQIAAVLVAGRRRGRLPHIDQPHQFGAVLTKPDSTDRPCGRRLSC